jgi:O-antigen/teichoic acid export membrane protein
MRLGSAATAARGKATRAGVPPALLDAAPVVVGLAALGASAYAFLVAAARGLGPVAFAPVSVAWTVVITIAAGMLSPFEQETGRVMAGRRAMQQGTRPVAVTSATAAAALASVVITAGVLAADPLSELLFRGDHQLLFVCLAAVAVLAATYVSRGLLAGTGAFPRYGVQLGAEGVLRGAGAVGLLVVGVSSGAAYAWLLALAPLLAFAVTLPPRDTLRPGPPLPMRDFAPRIGILLLTAALTGGMVNCGPVLVELLSDGAGPEAGIFLSVLVLTRVPLFLFAAVQAVVIPRLTHARADGLEPFRQSLRRTVMAVGALGAVGVLVFGLGGPELVRLFFGPAYIVDRDVAVVLALGAATYMVAMLLTQALVALDRHWWTVAAWVSGALVLAAVTAAVPDLEERVAWGLLAGSATAAAGLWQAVRRERER